MYPLSCPAVTLIALYELGLVHGLGLPLAGALVLRLGAGRLRHQIQLHVPAPCIVSITFWEALRVLLADLLAARSLSCKTWSI
jgi:hypothetical protein